MRLATTLIMLLVGGTLYAQYSPGNSPAVTRDYPEYQQQVIDDPTGQMVELQQLIPGLIYDLRYATTNNFMHRLMYPAGTRVAFLRQPAALALLDVQQELSKKGWGLKIFDAYRPYAVTVKFWELVGDERYVAHPARGSGHNRGIAVDLTIIDTTTGKELDMGTDFDNFSDTAHHNFMALPDTVLHNRQLLRKTMERYGFVALETEWWHYYLPYSNKYGVLDLSFDNLEKAQP